MHFSGWINDELVGMCRNEEVSKQNEEKHKLENEVKERPTDKATGG